MRKYFKIKRARLEKRSEADFNEEYHTWYVSIYVTQNRVFETWKVIQVPSGFGIFHFTRSHFFHAYFRRESRTVVHCVKISTILHLKMENVNNASQTKT